MFCFGSYLSSLASPDSSATHSSERVPQRTVLTAIRFVFIVAYWPKLASSCRIADTGNLSSPARVTGGRTQNSIFAGFAH